MADSKKDFDVIIIGGGGAGLAAAIEALNGGATALLCEAAQRVGGNAANSGGVVMAAGTEIQKARGVEDSAEDFYHHYMITSQYKVEPALIRQLCDKSAATIEWLQSLGVEFKAENLYVAGVENPKAPRGHPAEGNGFQIMQQLENAAMSKGLEVALNTRVTELLVDETGAVCGIQADGVKVYASSVIITSGGFSGNFELIKEHYPDAGQHGEDWHFAVGIDENRGDGLGLGRQAGASIIYTSIGNALITASFSHEPEPYIPGWMVYVNKEGFRFIDETAAYVVMDLVVNAQTDSVCYAIMDHAAFTRDINDSRYKTDEFLVFPTPNWMPDALVRHLENGYIKSAETLEELGEKTGIAPEALAATIHEYNRDVAKGADTHYLKDKKYLQPLSEPPYYAIELRAAGVGTTHTGLRINTDSEVISEKGRPVPGLYAAGEVTGGIMYYYVGGGASLLNNFVYGRIAGRNAAANAKK